MSNISQAIELAIVTQSSAPIPTNAVSYTGGSVTIQMGTVTNTTVPKMSGDFTDPITKTPYKYSVFGNGSYYQLGIDFENPLSFHTGIPGIETVYADAWIKYSKLSGNYAFDPSLPSLFVITGSINSASGGIFSPDTCFVMNNVPTNAFSANSGTCLKKKDYSLRNLDKSLVGYWDMETLTNSGLLKDLSGNGWNATCYDNNTFSGSCWVVGPVISSGQMLFDGMIGKSLRILNSTWMLAWEKHMTIIWIMTGNCDTSGNCIILRGGASGSEVKSLNFKYWVLSSEVSTNNINYKFFRYWRTININNSLLLWAITYDWSKVKLYIDGVLGNQYEWIGDTSSSNWDWFIWKMHQWDMNGTFSGTISEIKIYNRALSDSEIKQQTRVAWF